MNKLVLPFLVAVNILACSEAPVRSTVDSYGEISINKTSPHFFAKESLNLLDKQAALACEEGARASKLTISNDACPSCITVLVHTRLVGTQQVIRSSPGFGSSWGIFGPGGGLGLGYAGGEINSHSESGRELDLDFFSDSSLKSPVRQMQIRSVGKQNSVSAVAFEMCQAGFQEYPQNLKGKFYEIEARDQKKQ